MTSLALDAFVHEIRIGQNNRLNVTAGGETQPAKTSTLTFHLKPDLEKKFRMVKYQLEREKREPLTFEDVLEALLEPHWEAYLRKIPVLA